MILLLYANDSEKKYITYHSRACIGLNAVNLKEMGWVLSEFDGVVLFGSCGLLKEYYQDACHICDYPQNCFDCEWRVRYNEFIVPDKWINGGKNVIETSDLLGLSRHGIGLTWHQSVRSKYLTEYVKDRFPEAMCVDMESFIVGKYCQERKIPFVSVRYVIDRCNRKVMLPAFNHFWRKYQAKRMQRKFNELIISH